MPHPPHWSYYISLEDDLVATGKYVELCDKNLDTFSIQFTRLLLAAASEVDVVAKMLCTQIDPSGKHRNIDDYRRIIVPAFPSIPKIELGIMWNPIRIRPWATWELAKPVNPDWWQAYNSVKHQRNIHFEGGNLRNALGAIAGLYCLVLHLKENTGHDRPDRFLRIESAS